MRASAVWRLHHGTLRAVVQSGRLRQVVQVQSLPVLPSIAAAATAIAAAATRGVHACERDRRESGSVRELVRAEVGDGALPPMQVQGLLLLRETHTAAASSRSAAAAAEAARAPRRRGDAEWCHVRAAAGWRRERARLRLLLQAENR